jgi:hypothetical protein
MARGFLSEGGGGRSNSEDATVELELGWSTDKAYGFRDPFDKDKPKSLAGGSREKLIWVPKAVRGEPLVWDGPRTGAGKLTGPRWLLEKNGLL